MRPETEKNSRGFTLIELIVTVGIISMLAGAILVAVAPRQRIQEARDARRTEEAYSILTAFLSKQADDREYYFGESTAELDTDPATAQVIVETTVGATCTAAAATTPTCPGAVAGGLTLPTTGTACLAVLDDGTENSSGLVDKYLTLLPIDPFGAGNDPTSGVTDLPLGANNTGYYINRSGTGRIEIGACHPDIETTIKVKR